jgi:hypothetical protein
MTTKQVMREAEVTAMKILPPPSGAHGNPRFEHGTHHLRVIRGDDMVRVRYEKPYGGHILRCTCTTCGRRASYGCGHDGAVIWETVAWKRATDG